MTVSPLSVASDGYLDQGAGRTLVVAASGYLRTPGVEATPGGGGGGGASRRVNQFNSLSIAPVQDDEEIIAVVTAFLSVALAGRKITWDL